MSICGLTAIVTSPNCSASARKKIIMPCVATNTTALSISEDPAGKCLSWPQCERAGLVSQVLIRVYPRAHIFDVDPD